MARSNYGYGRWGAPFWFIGPEQGMGRHEKDLGLRVRAWINLGRLELNDCRKFHDLLGDARWHLKKPRVRLQATWRPLMVLMMTFLSRPTDKDSLRYYQRDRWGALDGETCVIELSGLAAPSLKEAADTRAFLSGRIEFIRQRIRDNPPKLVVMYGKGQRASWERIAGSEFPPEPAPFVFIKKTALVFTPHPVSRIREGNRYLGNEYWTRLGLKLREAAPCHSA